MGVDMRTALLLAAFCGNAFSAVLRGVPAFAANDNANGTKASVETLITAPHAGNDECASTLGVRMTSGYTNVDARFNLFPGVKVIFEVGGNIGQDLEQYIYRFGDAKIFSFEPVPELYQKLQQKFGHYHNVKIQQVGASDKDETVYFTIAGASGESSSHTNTSTPGRQITVQLRDVNALLGEVQHATGQVPDVFSINCEGCEYAVLGRMVAMGWLGRVPFVQMSWHSVQGVPMRISQRCAIEQVLWQHYTPVWHSLYGWQGWRLKSHR